MQKTIAFASYPRGAWKGVVETLNLPETARRPNRSNLKATHVFFHFCLLASSYNLITYMMRSSLDNGDPRGWERKETHHIRTKPWTCSLAAGSAGMNDALSACSISARWIAIRSRAGKRSMHAICRREVRPPWNVSSKIATRERIRRNLAASSLILHRFHVTLSQVVGYEEDASGIWCSGDSCQGTRSKSVMAAEECGLRKTRTMSSARIGERCRST